MGRCLKYRDCVQCIQLVHVCLKCFQFVIILLQIILVNLSIVKEEEHENLYVALVEKWLKEASLIFSMGPKLFHHYNNIYRYIAFNILSRARKFGSPAKATSRAHRRMPAPKTLKHVASVDQLNMVNLYTLI